MRRLRPEIGRVTWRRAEAGAFRLARAAGASQAADWFWQQALAASGKLEAPNFQLKTPTSAGQFAVAGARRPLARALGVSCRLASGRQAPLAAAACDESEARRE